MAEAAPRTVTLPLRAWVVVAIVVVAGLALFSAQLYFIVEQRRITGDQLGFARIQAVRARPVLRTADALLGSRPEALRAARRAGALATGLGGLLTRLRREDLVGLTATTLRRAPQLLADTHRTVALLERTVPTLRRSLGVQERSLAIQERSLRTQRASLEIQRTTLRVARRTLAVARATLAHTESLDRKTGGQVPPVLGGG